MILKTDDGIERSRVRVGNGPDILALAIMKVGLNVGPKVPRQARRVPIDQQTKDCRFALRSDPGGT